MTSNQTSSQQAQAATFEQRLLAEAVRIYEDNQSDAVADAQAEARACRTGGDLEQRILVRARHLSIAQPLQQALQQLRTISGLIVGAGLILAIIAGATAAQTTLGLSGGAPVNFFWLLGSLLGIPSLVLLIWLGLILFQPGTAVTGSLGGMLLALGRRLQRRLYHDSKHYCATQAVSGVLARNALGRWTISALSHALWIGFFLGCILMLVFMLSTRQYVFIWETTILSENTYIALTRSLSTLPDLLGFSTPDAAQIRVSQWPAEDMPAAVGEAWSQLLIACLLVYGLLPRILFTLLCYGLARHAANRFRLDLDQVGYMRLQQRLLPDTRSIGVIDPEPKTPIAASTASAYHAVATLNTTEPIAILGLEIELNQAHWPPPIASVSWLDLGIVDTRDQRRRAQQQIQDSQPPAQLVIVVCSLAATPDRGTRNFLKQLQQSIAAPLALLLSDGQRLRARGRSEEALQRVTDWHNMAAEAGIDEAHIIEVDLAHFTAGSRSRLAHFLGCSDELTATAVKQLPTAFATIASQVERWSQPPDALAQAELHRSLARLYENGQDHWRNLLAAPKNPQRELAQQLKSGAEHMLGLLPGSLQRRPRWLAAGATAGALGCVAAATLASPAAIAALPLWAGLGAALSWALPAGADKASQGQADDDFGPAVRSAALFALVLELQGHEENIITRILDHTIDPADASIISDAASARQWLDTLQQRFDLAITEESLA